MLWVNWPVIDTIHPFGNKIATGVKIKATGELKLNDSNESVLWSLHTNQVKVFP